MNIIRCVVVGDSASEKTSLLISYTSMCSLEDYIPTAFDNIPVTVMIDGVPYMLGLCDTTGQEDYHRLRPLAYPLTDIFLVCFSVVSPSSFQNVKLKWVPEISHHCPQTPYLLVGTQVHLRHDSNTLEKLAKMNMKAVTYQNGEEMAHELKAVKYMECSAFTREGVKNVFDEAILATLAPSENKPKQKHCFVL